VFFGSARRPIWLRQFGKKGLQRVGYYRRRLANQELPGIAVLCFHGVRRKHEDVPFGELHVTLETFTSVCRTVAESCTPVSLADIRAHRDGVKSLPPRPVLFTFDDGYASLLTNAMPVLERFSIPAAAFISPGAIQDGRHFWFDAMYRRFGEAAVTFARSLPHDEWASTVASVRMPARRGETHRPLTVDELVRLANNPLVEIAAHTMSHPVLAHATAEQQHREIVDSRTALVEMTGAPVRAFAYPFGAPSTDFANTAPGTVRAAGFDTAFTTEPSFADPSLDPLTLPRFVMLDSIGGAELAHRLAHSWPRTRSVHSGLEAPPQTAAVPVLATRPAAPPATRAA
jgi:peptidoglycan/xylan/chitin deacetylase (PgdA/CDA1 family)